MFGFAKRETQQQRRCIFPCDTGRRAEVGTHGLMGSEVQGAEADEDGLSSADIET